MDKEKSGERTMTQQEEEQQQEQDRLDMIEALTDILIHGSREEIAMLMRQKQ